MTEYEYDVVVVGGGAAGLSGALTLARARRRVLVVDAGEPRNAPAGHVHNYLGREGTPPAELLAIGRDEVRRYGGELVADVVTGAKADGTGFRVELTDRTVTARRLLVTTGVTDELPALPGLAERWGDTVLHCPYCHGWEVADRAVGILATSPMAAHQALLWRQWSADVTLFTHVAPVPTGAERARLDARGIRVVEGTVAGVEGGADVRLAGGELVARDALVVQVLTTARSAVLAGLGLEAVEQEMNGYLVGTVVPAEPSGATSVPGVYVAGNVSNLMAQVIVAAGAGLTTAAFLNADLVEEDADRAVPDPALLAEDGSGGDTQDGDAPDGDRAERAVTGQAVST